MSQNFSTSQKSSCEKLPIKKYKRIYNHAEIDKLLSENYDFVADLTEADIVITDDTSVIRPEKLNILISDEHSDYHLNISPTLKDDCFISMIDSIFKTFELSPRIDKISFLQEQNELLSEANKGLVELYNLIDNKNQQIEFLKNKLENIINSAGESIVEINPEGEIIFANKKFCDTTGYCKEDWGGMNFISMLTPDTRQVLVDGLATVDGEKTASIKAKFQKKSGEYISIDGHITLIRNHESHYEIIFEDVSKRLLIEQQMKKLEEKAIVAGFSRHLSHNILNALTVASGFLNKIKTSTCPVDGDNIERTDMHWRIIDDKCKLIEEIVTGYNDYTNAISLQTRDMVNLPDFYEDLVRSISDKKFEKAFSAFLYYLTEYYEVEYEFDFKGTCTLQANKHFLKLGLCYILKDIIRFFSDDLPIMFKIILTLHNGRFAIKILVDVEEVPQSILDSMTEPWNHQMLSQSFDYWGIVIANVIVEKHGGLMRLSRTDTGISIILEF